MYTWYEDMIYSTSYNEVREIKSSSIKVVEDLEELTGADIMLSPLALPVTQVLLSKHIQAGALLVQVKRGHDLVSSILDGRLHKSIAIMKAIKPQPQPWQCILLFVGELVGSNPDKSGTSDAFINGQPVSRLNSSQPYWTLKAAMAKWTKRGGSVETISRASQMEAWVSMQERVTEDMRNTKAIDVYPQTVTFIEPDDPLQDVIYINDWRKTLLTLPGIGPRKVSDIIAWTEKPVEELRLWELLGILSTQGLGTQIPGIGRTTVENVRAWLGLPEKAKLTIDFEEE